MLDIENALILFTMFLQIWVLFLNDFMSVLMIAACFLCSSQYHCIEFTKEIKLYGLKFKMCDAAMNMLACTTVSNCKCVYFQL